MNLLYYALICKKWDIYLLVFQKQKMFLEISYIYEISSLSFF